MKIYVMTDMECTAGVVSLPEYCLPSPRNKYGREEGGKYYEHARELATREVNAAIDGLINAGADEILVCDGHGPGGLNPTLIHPSAGILTGKGQQQPRGLDATFDGAIMVGQHAMAHTDGGHLCHSGSFSREDWLLNGQSIGEIGLFMLTATHFGVPVLMISGDAAACEEARDLVPSIVAVSVIEGQRRGSTRGMTTDEAIDLNVPAIHVSPERARRMIRSGAEEALRERSRVEQYSVNGPYEMVRIPRSHNGSPPKRATNRADNIVDLLAQPIEYRTNDRT